MKSRFLLFSVAPSIAFVFVQQYEKNAVISTRCSKLQARTPLIAGNWKENPCTLEEATELGYHVSKAASQSTNVDIVIIPPYTFLYPVNSVVGNGVMIGGQNCNFEEKGAYTGGVSTAMLESVGCKYVLCGHSERRTVFRNDDNAINRKLRAVLAHNMQPILCIGESKEEYDAGLVQSVCAIQLSKDLQGVTREEMKKVVLAYEPVWAIGTGLTATPKIAQEVHEFIRGYIATMFDADIANEIIIQYGGSVTPETIDALMAMPDIDGVLVGGASLDGAKFERIINYSK